MGPSEPEVRAALAGVDEPDLRRGLVELGMVGALRVKRRSVAVEVALPVAGWPGRDELSAALVRAVASVPGVDDVRVTFTPMDDEGRALLRAPAGAAGRR